VQVLWDISLEGEGGSTPQRRLAATGYTVCSISTADVLGGRISRQSASRGSAQLQYAQAHSTGTRRTSVRAEPSLRTALSALLACLCRPFAVHVCANGLESPDHLLHASWVERGLAMTFEEILDQAMAMLQRRGRLTYSTLKRQFQLDDAALEDVKNELIYGQRLAVDERGNVLVWTGAPGVTVSTDAAAAGRPTPAPLTYTPPYLAEKILT